MPIPAPPTDAWLVNAPTPPLRPERRVREVFAIALARVCPPFAPLVSRKRAIRVQLGRRAWVFAKPEPRPAAPPASGDRVPARSSRPLKSAATGSTTTAMGLSTRAAED